jgi:competence protein ComEC
LAGVAGNIRWEILWPVPGRPPPEENDASLVLGIRAGPDTAQGLSALLTGDVESEAAARMLMRLGTAPPAVDVLKISHHGARNGGTALIEALRPAAALISVGRGNDYGHPAPEIITALQRDQVPVYRTDLLGTILLDYRDGRLQVMALP